MFEYLENDPIIDGQEPATPENMKYIRENLGKIAPDFVEFVEKFGCVTFGDGHFGVYGWIEDLAEFFEENMGEKPSFEAWLFGDDFSGDFHAIDKQTGEVVFVSAGYAELDEIRHPSFESFIRYLLRD